MSFDLKLINGDLSIKNGDMELVTGGDKLIQDILKISVTPAGANPFSLWYGSLIAKTLIGSHLDQDIIVESAKNHSTSTAPAPSSVIAGSTTSRGPHRRCWSGALG